MRDKAEVRILSVVIASYRSRHTIGACLRSVEQQSRRPDEIIVVDSGQDGTAELISAEFPQVRLFALAERKYAGAARNIGLQHASGQVIAFLDADCVVPTDWSKQILQAHQDPDPLIGGAIGSANPESQVGWAAYFCELSQWIPGGTRRNMTEVPAGSLSIKSWAFEKYGPFIEGTYCSDTAFNWRALADGYRPVFEPAIRVYHSNITRLGKFLPKQVMHGRAFATVRIQEKKICLSGIAGYWIGSPLLPFLLFQRVLGRVLRRRAYWGRFFKVSPIVFVGLAAWSWGECLGYWTGLWSALRVAVTPASVRRSTWCSRNRN